MNITFIIGNGFDMSLDLKTGYKNFYPYFQEKAGEDNILVDKIKADEKKKYANWSDLELALGKFTSILSEDDIDAFVKSKVNLDKLLKEYLLNEEQKFQVDEDDKALLHAISNLRKTNVEDENTKIKKTLEVYNNQSFTYRAITLNYTNCFDQIWNIHINKEVGKHTYNGSSKTESVGNLLHLHGTLHDGEMIVGVNDDSQIENAEIRTDRRIRRALIKKQMNSEIGQNKISKAKDIITNSMIICLYGVSIGDTDGMWWELIGTWLKQSEYHLLIIYNFEPEFSADHPFELLEHRDAVKNKLLRLTSLSAGEKTKVSNQIIIKDNEKLFEK